MNINNSKRVSFDTVRRIQYRLKNTEEENLKHSAIPYSFKRHNQSLCTFIDKIHEA